MGTVISKAAGGLGAAVGNAFAAPFKTIFGANCEGICSGTWDIICFIEHLCVSSLVRLFMVLVLTYITLLFVYLLFKVGIIQCIGRSLCKMTWAACSTYWAAMEEMTCFLWYKLRNTKRVYRRRFEDVEEELSSSYGEEVDDDSSEDDHGSFRVIRRRRSVRERRRDRMRRSLYPKRMSSRARRRESGRHHHVRLKTREVSLHVNSAPLRPRKASQHTGRQLFNKRNY
ncbi:uncharacterized protein [Typha latifolia]|uniref:uncharacterized protein n=1 Tax=Typha latifolia TaxID=4733 RepID=UPI003C2CD078